MAKNMDFSIELPEPQAPNSTAGVEQLHQARQASAAASATHAQRVESFGKFLGTQALEAAKGQAEANLSAEIDAIIKRTKWAAERDITLDARKQAAGLLESQASDDYMGDQTIKAFADEATKFANARVQGLISNDEAIMRMGEAIKRYSAMAPGWATEFRKIGAEKTGISNLDVYGLHKSLLDQADKEAASAIAKKNLELQYNIAKKHGFARIEDVPPEVYAAERIAAAAEERLKYNKNLLEEKKLSREEATRIAEEQSSLLIGQQLSGLTAKFMALNEAHMNANTVEGRNAAQKQGALLSADLDRMEMAISTDIRALVSKGMDPKRNQEIVDNLHKTISGYKEYVKSAEGYNWFIKNAQNTGADVKLMMDNFKLANPLVEVWRETGVAPGITQAYFTLPPEAFKSRFSEEGYRSLQRVLGDGAAAYMKTMRGIHDGTLTIGDIRDAEVRKVAINDVHQTLLDLLKKQKDGGGLTDKEKKVYGNLLGNFAETWQPTAAGIKGMNAVLNSDEGLAALAKLNPAERAQAMTQVYDRLQTVLPATVRDVQTQVEAINKMAKDKGMFVNVEVVFDPRTNRMRAVINQEKRPKAAAPTSVGGTPFHTGAIPVPVGRRFESDINARGMVDTLNRRLEVLNLAPDLIANTAPLMRPDVKVDAGVLSKQLFDSVKNPKEVPVDIVHAAVGVPRNTPEGKAAEEMAKTVVTDRMVGDRSKESSIRGEGLDLPKPTQADIDELRGVMEKEKNPWKKRAYQQALEEMTGAK